MQERDGGGGRKTQLLSFLWLLSRTSLHPVLSESLWSSLGNPYRRDISFRLSRTSDSLKYQSARATLYFRHVAFSARIEMWEICGDMGDTWSLNCQHRDESSTKTQLEQTAGSGRCFVWSRYTSWTVKTRAFGNILK